MLSPDSAVTPGADDRLLQLPGHRGAFPGALGGRALFPLPGGPTHLSRLCSPPTALGEAPSSLLLSPQTPFILGKLSARRSQFDEMTFSEPSHERQCVTDDDCGGERGWRGLGPGGL